MSERERPTVRVEFTDTAVEVTSTSTLAMNKHELYSRYETFDKLPQWMQDKIIRLQILPNPPPPIKVSGLGQKINDRIYWVETD